MVSAGIFEKTVGLGFLIILNPELFEILAKDAIAKRKRGNTVCGY